MGPLTNDTTGPSAPNLSEPFVSETFRGMRSDRPANPFLGLASISEAVTTVAVTVVVSVPHIVVSHEWRVYC